MAPTSLPVASKARRVRNGSPPLIGPALFAGANSQTPRTPVRRSHPRRASRWAMILAGVRIPACRATREISSSLTMEACSSSRCSSTGANDSGIVRAVVGMDLSCAAGRSSRSCGQLQTLTCKCQPFATAPGPGFSLAGSSTKRRESCTTSDVLLVNAGSPAMVGPGFDRLDLPRHPDRRRWEPWSEMSA